MMPNYNLNGNYSCSPKLIKRVISTLTELNGIGLLTMTILEVPVELLIACVSTLLVKVKLGPIPMRSMLEGF